MRTYVDFWSYMMVSKAQFEDRWREADSVGLFLEQVN